MKKLLYLLCVALLLCCCDGWDFGKPESCYLDYLPKKTQIGANTFGCYINGELAASKGYSQREGDNTGYVNGFWRKYSDFFDRERNDTIMRFDFEVKQASLYIEYSYLQRNIYECEVYIRFRDNPDLSGSIDTIINVTRFDRSAHIISGELNALDIPLYNKDSVVHLRKIRFDIKYGSNF